MNDLRPSLTASSAVSYARYRRFPRQAAETRDIEVRSRSVSPRRQDLEGANGCVGLHRFVELLHAPTVVARGANPTGHHAADGLAERPAYMSPASEPEQSGAARASRPSRRPRETSPNPACVKFAGILAMTTRRTPCSGASEFKGPRVRGHAHWTRRWPRGLRRRS